MTRSVDLTAAERSLTAGAIALRTAVDRHVTFRARFSDAAASLRAAWESPDSEMLQTGSSRVITELGPIGAALGRASDISSRLASTAGIIAAQLAELEREMARLAAAIQQVQVALNNIATDEASAAALQDELRRLTSALSQVERQHSEAVRYWRLTQTSACSELQAELDAVNRLAQVSWLFPDLEPKIEGGRTSPALDLLEDALGVISDGAGAYRGPKFIQQNYVIIEHRLTARSGSVRSLPDGRRVWIRPHIVASTRIRESTTYVPNPAIRRWETISRRAGFVGTGISGFLIGYEEYHRVQNDPSLSSAQRAASVGGAVVVEGGFTWGGGAAGVVGGAKAAGIACSAVAPGPGTLACGVTGAVVGGLVGSGAGNAVGSRLWDLGDDYVVGAVGWVEDRVEDVSDFWDDTKAALGRAFRFPRR